MTKYVPESDQHDTNYVNAYNSAMVLEAVLKACGDDLSTENILKQAYAIKDLELPMLLPGIKVNTSPTDHVPVDQMQFMRFNGKSWDRFGELQTGRRIMMIFVMAGLVPAIHVLAARLKVVDARDKPGHDEVCAKRPGPAFPSALLPKSR